MAQYKSASVSKLVALIAGLMVLPAIASCASDTAQTPTQTAPTAPATTEAPATTGSPTATGQGNVVDVAASEQSLSTLASVIQQAGLAETLQQGGPYTVFAPSDQAFAAIPEATRQKLLQPENRETLRQILTYHVVPGELTADQLQSGQVETVAGQPVSVQVNQSDSQVKVNDATVTRSDLQANNGVIHIVDRVILPPDVNL